MNNEVKHIFSCLLIMCLSFWKMSILTFTYFFSFFLNFTLFYFTILYWFCHTSTWIRHRCTWVPNPEPSSHLPPHIISLGHPSTPAPSILYPALNLNWRFISYMILYMFQCHSPKSSHPLPLPLPQSKRLFYTSVSLLKDFCKNQLGFWSSVLNTKLKLISLYSMEALVITLEASDSTEAVRLQTLSERTLDRTQSSRSLPAEYV